MKSIFTGCTDRRALALTLSCCFALGCSEVRGRKLAQEGNELYKSGRYSEAVAVFEQAQKLVPDLPTLWLNKGYTCRQLIVPGSKDPRTQRAVACALDAFQRLGKLQPGDARADQLTVETMFDAEEWPKLEALFLERNRQKPDDVDVVRGLQQVYYKSGRWAQALEWSKRVVALRRTDPEAHYGVGTFIWQVLSSKGGGPEMAAYDPRPRLPPANDPNEMTEIPAGRGAVKGKVKSPPPVPVAPPAPIAGPDAVTGPRRVELADEGIRYLEEAVRLRPRYAEAMTYLALLYRQKSFAFFAGVDVAKWQEAVDKANEWQKRANVARTGKS